MSTQLRPYQIQLVNDAWSAFAEQHRFLLLVLPTGGGKTVCMGEIFRRMGYVPMLAIAHRQELVWQLARALASQGIFHRILSPEPVVEFISTRQRELFGRTFVDHNSPVIVAGVDTLIRRELPNEDQVQFWLTDEGHHVLWTNKWGRAIKRFRNAWGAALTATPARADRRALSHGKGGVFHKMIVGPTAAELVDMGFIVPVEFFGPPPSMDRGELEMSKTTGDFSMPKMRNAAHRQRARIVGDVAAHYLRIAPGERGLTFAVDVELARDHVKAFLAAGVPAAMVTDETKMDVRTRTFGMLETGELKMIVNVDIAGEGTDLPSVSVICDAKPTESFPAYAQRVGRVRRLDRGKTHGKYIDHVGNFAAMTRRYGHLDEIVWDELDAEVGRRRVLGPRGEPIRQCAREGCWRSFQSWSLTCPHCGHAPEVTVAKRPEEVEGDLLHYGPELIAELRRQAVDAGRLPRAAPATSGKEYMQIKYMEERAQAQRELREVISWWSGIRLHQGMTADSDRYRRFFHTFGIDAYSAQGLGGPDARKLTAAIREELGV